MSAEDFRNEVKDDIVEAYTLCGTGKIRNNIEHTLEDIIAIKSLSTEEILKLTYNRKTGEGTIQH